MYKKIYITTLIAAIGGFVFGLNMAGISGAINRIQEYFNLDNIGLGFVVSSLTIGCLLGALFAGSLSEKYGRKRLFLFIAALFVVSSLGCALSTNLYLLMLFRFISGIAVGADSVIGPMYISEMAPVEKRGRLVSFQQFAIVTGILFAYLVDYFLLDVKDSWRYMLAVPSLFGIIFFLLTYFFLKESNIWHNKKQLCASIKKSNEFRIMFKGRNGYVVMIGVVLAALQQITGINAIINYVPIIFSKTGVGSDVALLQSCIVGLVNFFATIIALWLVDIKGRRTLLLWGAIGMIFSLGYLTLSFMFGWSNLGILLALLIYIAFFAASFSPVMWVINSEIFPEIYRAQAMSLATAISWICTFITVQFSPLILNKFGGSVLFGCFFVLSIIALFFVWKFIPETKGKTFEQIQRELKL